MCGIFGYVGKRFINFKAACDIIEHRGPDSDGFLQYYVERDEISRTSNVKEQEAQRVLFGFRRLAIIDLEERSNQPFSTKDEKYHIVFNGEIYNYPELRLELEKIGYTFSTQSDTEVLLKSYIAWGTKCFAKCNGMWALSILDLEKKQVVSCRDRFGIKPFYYHYSKRFGLAFGSEIKQLRTLGLGKSINETIVRDYIDKAVVDFSQETFFEGIQSLKPGSFMITDLDLRMEPSHHTYWELKQDSQYAGLNYEEAKSKFKTLFEDSVGLRFRSDVRVGSCLSGGLDSSSIVGVAATNQTTEISTFTSKFDNHEIDESEYVHLVLDKYPKLDGHFCELTSNDFLTHFDRVLFHQDEPFTTMSMLAQWKVMETSKANNVIVLLDGQGGDESLAGYRKFYAFYIKELLGETRGFKAIKELFYLFKHKEFNFFDKKGIKRYLGLNKPENIYSNQGQKLVYKSNIGIGSANTLIGRSKLDIERYSFPPLLRYEDRNSMAHSIETRIPFMDYRLVTFLYSLPSNYKIRKGFTKAILRDAMSDMLPLRIKNRISKLGFETPQDSWMNGELNDYFSAYFSKMENPYLKTPQVEKIFNKKNRDNNLCFRIFCFDKWYHSMFEK